MRIGVVSDTHNNLKNIDFIINLFNEETVDLVIHTGDITQATSLDRFKELNCEICGVFGNNDRNEIELIEFVRNQGLNFCEPPHIIEKGDKKIVIFHEPDYIHDFLSLNDDIDLVLHGHTHRFREDFFGQTLIYNPGESAGMLKGKNAVGIIDLDNLNARRIFF